jgi:phosphohistidine phosphatase
MKTLLLLRHAKSSWDNPSLRDFERPLNERGLKAAPLMGRFMSRRGLRPDLVISSPAERARATASLVLEAARLAPPVRFDARVYEAPGRRLLEVVSGAEEPASTLLLVGHNPGMEELIELLTGETRRVPTAALARVALDTDTWADLSEGAGRLEELVKPKELKDED